MGIEDLKLEFEDENAEKDKSNGVIDLDVELSFNAGSVTKKAPAKPAPIPVPENSDGTVKNLQVEREKRTQTSGVHPNLTKKLAQETTAEIPHPDRFASVDEVQFLKEEVDELREQMSEIKIESEVRARVAEEKMQFLVEHHSEAKLLNYQLTQLLQRMGTKAPALKNELLMSKKLLDEFLKKLTQK